VELYEVDAVLAVIDGGVVRGQDEIRLLYGQLTAAGPASYRLLGSSTPRNRAAVPTKWPDGIVVPETATQPKPAPRTAASTPAVDRDLAAWRSRR